MTVFGIWSGFLLYGKSISKKQAAEVIIRTTPLRSLSFISEKWCQEVFGAFGIPIQSPEDILDPEYDPAFEEAVSKYKMLCDSQGFPKLEYFSNWQISSKLGPHGWCDWDGDLVANSFDIGPRPFEEAILEEWSLLSSTFPFLDLKFNLMEGSISDRSSKPYYEYTIKDGSVTITQDFKNPIITPHNYYPINPSEKGVSLEYLKWALEQIYG